MVAVGFVLHLNFLNPYLSPFEEFSVSRRIRPSRMSLRVASVFPMAMRLPKVADPGASCRSRVERSSAVRRLVWSACRASRAATMRFFPAAFSLPTNRRAITARPRQ